MTFIVAYKLTCVGVFNTNYYIISQGRLVTDVQLSRNSVNSVRLFGGTFSDRGMKTVLFTRCQKTVNYPDKCYNSHSVQE